MEVEVECDKVLTEALVLAKTRAQDLEAVKKLNCWGEQIVDVTIAERLPNLEICSLSVNSLSSLRSFEHCEHLQELYIRKNKISDLTEICYLRDLPKLRILWLADNPCAKTEKYRLTVLKTLGNLQKLDNITVTEDEHTEALEHGLDLTHPGTGLNHTHPDTGLNHTHPDTNPDHSSDQNHEDSEATKNEDVRTPPKSDAMSDAATLSMDETNKIREQFGLKPLPADKLFSPVKPLATTRKKKSNTVQAILLLLKGLDKDDLQTVQDAIQLRLNFTAL